MFLNFLFLTSTILTLGSALAVLITKNIMHSCMALLGTLMGVAGLYLTLGADLVAATQVMVYMGGVVILMVFAVMLTGGNNFQSRAQKIFKLVPSMGNKWTYGMGALAALIVMVTFRHLISYFIRTNASYVPGVDSSTVESLGYLLVSKYVLVFEVSSVLLLGALVGAAIIARPKKTITKEEDRSL